MFQGLRTTVYRVQDLAAARAWYNHLLGIDPYFDEVFYVGYNVGGFELGLMPIEAPATGPEVLTYWGVSNADEAYARLLRQSATPHDPVSDVGGGIRLGTVRDPFGNLIGVIENPHFKAE